MSTDICLLIDNSNTRTKFALGTRTGVGEIRILPTRDLTVEGIRQLLAGWCFNRVCCCSVVPEAGGVISAALERYPLQWVKAASVKDVDFSCYPGIATLGADRVVNVLAAVSLVPLPLVAVDMGTATTFDVVVQGSSGPQFTGGVIAPGYKSFAACLPSSTAQLPEVVWNADAPFVGRNTSEAMSAGVVAGYAGMLDSLLDGIEREVGEVLHVVLTGGDAAAFAPLLRHSSKVCPGLTLQGLAIAAGLL